MSHEAVDKADGVVFRWQTSRLNVKAMGWLLRPNHVGKHEGSRRSADYTVFGPVNHCLCPKGPAAGDLSELLVG